MEFEMLKLWGFVCLGFKFVFASEENQISLQLSNMDKTKQSAKAEND